MKGLPASTGLEWLKQGFELFRKQPGILMMLIFANFMISVLLAQLSIPGVILANLAIPSFTMAIQQACRLIDDGQRVHPRVLLTGFQKGSIGPLFKLGMVYLGIAIVLMVVVVPFINVESLKTAIKMMEAKKEPVFDSSTVLAFFTYFVVLLLAMLAMVFAPGLTYWKRMPTFKAIFYSLFAVLGAKAPFAIMIVTWLGITTLVHMLFATIFGRAAIAQVFVMWLGFISILIFQCSLYVAYKQILGAPEEDPAPPK